MYGLYAWKHHIVWVQMNVVKTSEGHIGLFPSSVIKVRKDLSCDVCDFMAPKPSNLVRHMSKVWKDFQIQKWVEQAHPNLSSWLLLVVQCEWIRHGVRHVLILKVSRFRFYTHQNPGLGRDIRRKGVQKSFTIFIMSTNMIGLHHKM